MEAVIHNCGCTKINTMDVLHSYHNIILLHNLYYHWVNLCMQYEGPQLDQIYKKGLSMFPRLTNLNDASVMDFYNKLHKTTSAYLIPIMPFDCVSIKMGFKALCPPGLGVPNYAAIAGVLLEVLPKLLPKSESQITTLITVIWMESNTGYDLLWRLLELVVPGFDPAIPVRIPM
jgi:hypothetical protein